MNILQEGTNTQKEALLSKEGKRIYLIIFFLLCLGLLRYAYKSFVAPTELKNVFQSEQTKEEVPNDVLDVPTFDIPDGADNYNE